MAWDSQWLVFKIGDVLAQIQELRCMQKHIMVARMAQAAKGGLHHFLSAVFPRIFPENVPNFSQSFLGVVDRCVLFLQDLYLFTVYLHYFNQVFCSISNNQFINFCN